MQINAQVRQRMVRSTLTGAVFACFMPLLAAQTAPATDTATGQKSDEDVVQLSPFEVTSGSNEGYMATSSLAGTRLNTQLKDVASAIQVVTPQFLKDTGATNVTQLLVYTTNSQVAGPGGNFYGSNAGDTGYRNNFLTEPYKTQRIRGLGSADLTRDYFLTDVPMDAYNITSVDIQRGPNAILFGLGSPAGIINYELKTANASKNSYAGEFRFGSYGSTRESVDINQVLVKNQLAIRLDGLNTDTKYRQDFTYEKQKRQYASVRWTPKLADTVYTQFQVNYEHGKIKADRPSGLPPEDWISPWFTNLNKWVHTNNLQNGGPSDDISGFLSGGPGGNWWDSLGVIYADPTSAKTGAAGEPDAIRQRGGNPWGGWVSPQPLAWAWGSYAPYNQKAYFANNPMMTQIINNYEASTGNTYNGMSGFSVASIQDPSIFNFYDQTLYGPNNTQFNNFRTLNLSFVQTCLDGRAGVEVVYDKQNYQAGYQNLIGGEDRISVDINATLRDGTPNPNLGRAMFVDGTDAKVWNTDRENFRATAFGKIRLEEFLKKQNLLTEIFGEQTVTGVYARQRNSYLNRGYNMYVYNAQYTANDNDDRVFGVHYIGPSLMNVNSLAGANLPGLTAVQAPPANLNAMVQGKGTLPDWSVIPIGTVNESSGLDGLYNGASQGYDLVDNRSVVWQSHFFDDTVVGLIGWRKDVYSKFDKGQVPTNAAGKAMPYDPSWSYAGGSSIHVEAQTRSKGIMIHSPKFINKYLPWGTTLSFGYNESSNFRPSEVGTDIYGNQYPAPAGQTKDYTFLLSTLNDRLTFRVTRFKTIQANSTFRGTAPGAWDIKGILARAMNGMMTETWIDGRITADANGDLKGRQNTTPETIVNKWMFGDSYDQSIANTPLPSGWTVQNHPELLTEPLRIRASAQNIHQGDINPASGQPYTEPPITVAEADYRAAWFAAQPDSEWYRPFGQDLFNGLQFKRDPNRKWGFWTEDTPPNLKQIADTVSKGTEYEVTANPTPHWRIVANASEQEAESTNIMQALGSFITQNRSFWHDGYVPNQNANQNTYWQRTGFANIDFWGNNNSQTFSQWTTGMERSYLIGKASEGRAVAELRKWAANVISTYDFSQGVLKGVSVGGAVRWQDKAIIGYYPEYMSDAQVWISDLTKPIYAPSETNYDAWISYSRKLPHGLKWSIALNVRDLFAKKKLIPIVANPDGSIAQVRIPASTTWEVTNRIEF